MPFVLDQAGHDHTSLTTRSSASDRLVERSSHQTTSGGLAFKLATLEIRGHCFGPSFWHVDKASIAGTTPGGHVPGTSLLEVGDQPFLDESFPPPLAAPPAIFFSQNYAHHLEIIDVVCFTDFTSLKY